MISIFQKGFLCVLFVCFLVLSALKIVFLWELKFSIASFQAKKEFDVLFLPVSFYIWKAFHSLNFSVEMLKMQWRSLLPSP